MRPHDLIGFASRSLRGAPKRTLLMLLAMGIGVASVIVLTALGEGARRYVTGEFAQLGTHLLIMLPGRSETTGGAPPLFGETPRDLTLGDAQALLRAPSISRIAPLAVGSAPASAGSREREVTVIGVLAGGGHSLGRNLDDMVVIPVASAQQLFDSPSLFRILIQARSEHDIEAARDAARQTIRARHDGEDDVTIITQDALLSTFDDILRALTYAVGGIAAISLAVAGILIMNVMLVAVSQRVEEIGLLKALGASQRQVLSLFLVEATLLATAGALLGLLLATATIAGLGLAYPSFPVAAPLWSPPAAVAVAFVTGLAFGALPARRAARLDPVQALTGR